MLSMIHRFPGGLPVVLREKVQASDEEGAFLMQGETAGSGVFPEVLGNWGWIFVSEAQKQGRMAEKETYGVCKRA